MKIIFLKIKNFILKFFKKEQKIYNKYLMEDYFKACFKTDLILGDFRYKLDILSCHLLSPTRADLYKKNLDCFMHKQPFINFFL